MYFTTEEKQSVGALVRAIIMADGKVVPTETLFIAHTVNKLGGLTDSQIMAIEQFSPERVKRILGQMSSEKKRLVSAILVTAPAVDGDIADIEMELVINMLVGIGLPLIQRSEALRIVENNL